MAKRIRVLDSWAVVAYFEAQPGGEQVREMLVEMHESSGQLLMCVVNVGEVWYSLARGHSPAIADEKTLELAQLGVEFVDADWELTKQAAVFKMKGNIAYADCFAAALAKGHKAELVTGDPEFRQVENEIRIFWLA